MSSGLDWEQFGVITGGDEVCILPPPTLSEKGVGIPTLSISEKPKIKMPNGWRTIKSLVHKILSASHGLRLGMDGMLLALCDHGFERSGLCAVNNNNNNNTKFDFTVDERKEWPNPSREKS